MAIWGSAEAAKAGLVLLGDGAQGFVVRDEMRNSTGATEEALGKLETKSDTFRKTFKEVKKCNDCAWRCFIGGTCSCYRNSGR